MNKIADNKLATQNYIFQSMRDIINGKSTDDETISFVDEMKNFFDENDAAYSGFEFDYPYALEYVLLYRTKKYYEMHGIDA